jgi:hypothetical protein
MSRRAFKPTAEQRGGVEAMIGYGMPEAEIRLLIKHPQTGEPISLETLRKHFAEEIATGAVMAKALASDLLRGSSVATATSKTTGRASSWLYSLPRRGWAGPWRTAISRSIRSMWRRRGGASIKNSPGSCAVSTRERLADRQRVERDKIVNFAARTRMSLASMAGPMVRNPFPTAASPLQTDFSRGRSRTASRTVCRQTLSTSTRSGCSSTLAIDKTSYCFCSATSKV